MSRIVISVLGYNPGSRSERVVICPIIGSHYEVIQRENCSMHRFLDENRYPYLNMSKRQDLNSERGVDVPLETNPLTISTITPSYKAAIPSCLNISTNTCTTLLARFTFLLR